MATLIRCPNCKTEMDSSVGKPGSIIKCSNCRQDMRLPHQGPLKPEETPRGMARHTPFFRRMAGATAPGARGRPAVGRSDHRGAASQPSGYNNGLAIGGAVAGFVALIAIAWLVMRDKETAAPPEKPKKLVARKFVEEPPPPPVAADAPKAPFSDPGGPPSSWEPDASANVSSRVKPVVADPALEQEAVLLMKAGNTDRINNSPYVFLPHVINTLVSDDKVLAHAAFRALAAYCEHASILDDKQANPVKLEWFNSARYRGYAYELWAGSWWGQNAQKLPDAPIAGGGTNLDRVDWVGLARQLKGGGYHDPTTHQGVAFRKLKSYGKGAYPRLAGLLSHEDISLAADVNNILNELTGQKMPKLTEVNRSNVQALWNDWINRNK